MQSIVTHTGNELAPLAPFYARVADGDVTHVWEHDMIMRAYNMRVWKVSMHATYVDLDGNRQIVTTPSGKRQPLRTFTIAVDLEFGGYRIASTSRKHNAMNTRLYTDVRDAVRELHNAYLQNDARTNLTLKETRAWLAQIRNVSPATTSRDWLRKSGQTIPLDSTVGDMLTATRNKPSRIASNGERERLGLVIAKR